MPADFEKKLIEVCSECGLASCYHGEFMCSENRDAGTELKTVAELRKSGLEHESHWRDDNLNKIYGDPAPNGYLGESKTTGTIETNHCVIINGPDDITGPYSEIDALKKANEINLVYVRERSKHGPEDTPFCVATVEHAGQTGDPDLQ